MEVTIPQAQPGELDFSDPGVLFQELRQGDQDFVKFLEEETSHLRALLLAHNPRNRDAYEHLFDASTSIVRNTLEMIWYDEQDCNNLRKGALQLEEKKKEMGRKLNEYKREIELPRCEITGLQKFNQATFQTSRPKMEEIMNELASGADMLHLRDRIEKASYVSDRDMKRLPNLFSQANQSITIGDYMAGHLQYILVKRQSQALMNKAYVIKFVLEKRGSVWSFLAEWNEWICKVLEAARDSLKSKN